MQSVNKYNRDSSIGWRKISMARHGREKMMDLGIYFASNGERFQRIFLTDHRQVFAVRMPDGTGAGSKVEASTLPASNPKEATRLIDEWLDEHERKTIKSKRDKKRLR